MTPYFPDFETKKDSYVTIIRKLHEGKYYKWIVVAFFSDELKNDRERAIRFLIRESYKAIMFGIISPSICYDKNTPIFQMDENQESEEERLGIKPPVVAADQQ